MEERGVLGRRFGGTAIATASLLAATTVLGWAHPASAQITVTASRSSLLYSTTSPDCSALSKIMDDTMLPLNVARLTIANAPTGTNIGYHWSLKKSSKGMLAADLDIGAGAETPAINAMCSSFGSACLLTKGQLNFYNENHILFAAPTCDVLPTDTRKRFGGGVSRVSVKVTEGKHKIGKASVEIACGRNGGVTLLVSDMEDPPQFKDGMPRPFPVQVFANPTFAWDAIQPNPLPAGTVTASFSGGGTEGALCGIPPPPQADGCQTLVFPAPAKYLVLLKLIFEDASALCDNITINVAACTPDGRLDVIPKPTRSVYNPANPSQANVNLRVRLTNTSKPRGGLPACPFLLGGANVLSCTGALKVGSVTDSRTTTFDLKHCSVTTGQGCLSNADCAPFTCPACQPNEICLTQPHCSKAFTNPCGNDADCREASPTCPTCVEGETCIRILALETGPAGTVFLRPGESIDLFEQPVTLSNVLTSTARISDTWTANVQIPEVSFDDTFRYRIKGSPQP
jgi:hypothetical protein